MSTSLSALKKEIRSQANPAKAILLGRFFKTGKGGYAEGDRFLGIMVPTQRVLAKKYRDVTVADALRLLRSPYHEERLIALLLLIRHFEQGSPEEQKRIYTAYLQNTRHINNWDLVDLSSHRIVGAYLYQRSRQPLYQLARSQLLWDRRIAIIGTAAFIAGNDLDDTFRIATVLLKDKHDLIHKAVGWMLREAGKKDPEALRAFLQQHAPRMPRTALRYAIEKYSPRERRRFLKQ